MFRSFLFIYYTFQIIPINRITYSHRRESGLNILWKIIKYFEMAKQNKRIELDEGKGEGITFYCAIVILFNCFTIHQIFKLTILTAHIAQNCFFLSFCLVNEIRK